MEGADAVAAAMVLLDQGVDLGGMRHPRRDELYERLIEITYVPHIRYRGELENPVKRYKPKRWVVERSA